MIYSFSPHVRQQIYQGFIGGLSDLIAELEKLQIAHHSIDVRLLQTGLF
jgi:hypothetical protein